MSLPVFRVGDESDVHEFLSNSSKDELIAFLVEANARCEDLAAKNQRLRVGLERVQEVEHRMSDRLDANEHRWRNQVENLIAENEKLKALEKVITDTQGWGDFVADLPVEQVEALRNAGYPEEDLVQD